ncbi:RidA family protein [uncultured Tyzzerella sp.]|uniref:RidA family protein n=1 Tax=uncultured Tyzzerella sp. TaxID=2321398 RepID=UPI002941C105|nr:RidA family protein [uncultured Tyzzerella sp.]
MRKIHSDKAPKAIGPYSQAVLVNNSLYTSGQIALNTEGNIVGDNVTEQTEQVMQNLKAVLEEAGTNFENTIKTTCFLSDMKNFADFNEVYCKYFTSNPARSCVAVRELPKQVLVEVEVIALVK